MADPSNPDQDKLERARLLLARKAVIEKHFDEWWPSGKRDCPICGRHDDFVYTEDVTITYDNKDRNKSLPMFLVVCDRCGHALFFSSKVVGLDGVTGEVGEET